MKSTSGTFQKFTSLLGGSATLIAATLAMAGAAHGQTLPAVPVVPGELIVKVPSSMSRADVESLAAGAGCNVVRQFSTSSVHYLFRLKTRAAAKPANLVPTRAVFNLPRYAGMLTQEMVDAASKLRTTPGVMADPNVIQQLFQAPSRTTPNDPYFAEMGLQQWHLNAIRMPEAWTIQTGTRAVRIGVIDSGIDADHEDFVTADGAGSQIDVANSRNFFPDAIEDDDDDNDDTPANPADIEDRQGHGTHVAGTIGATTNNGKGVAGIAGWNRNNVNVKLVVARVFGNGTAPTSVIVEGIQWMTLQNVDAINLSLGADGAGLGLPRTFAEQIFAIERDAVNQALAAGITVVAAAGNSGLNGSDTTLGDFNWAFPADYDGVIKVSSVAPSLGGALGLATYSNYGGPVAVAAPGGEGPFADPNTVWSTWPMGGSLLDPQHTRYNGLQGTSMAAPHVSGVVALMLAGGAPRNPATIKQVIQNTAQPLPDEQPNPNGGNRYGAGLLDAYRAIQRYSDPEPAIDLMGAVNRGTTYYTSLRDIGAQLQVVGVKKILNPTNPNMRPLITVQVIAATEPESAPQVTYQFVSHIGPNGEVLPGPESTLEIPPLAAGELPATPKIVQIPPSTVTPPTLGPGRYIIRAILSYIDSTGAPVGGEVSREDQVVYVRSRKLPIGLSMFALPYQVRQVDNANPERSVLGPTGFTLKRFNPLQPDGEGGGDVYFTLDSNENSGEARLDAGFAVGTSGTGAPLTFGLSNPTVSVAPVGVGYWLNLAPLDGGGDRFLTPLGPTVPENQGPVSIRLFANGGGWNMIGAPYDYAVDWKNALVRFNTSTGERQYSMDEAVAQNILSPTLVGYEATEGYVYNVAPFGKLLPFRGYWVQAYQDCTLIIPRQPAQFDEDLDEQGGTRATARGSNIPAVDGWRVRLSAVVAGDRDGQNYFGQARGAAEGQDQLDIAKPPVGGGHAYVRFMSDRGNGSKAAYAFDMRPLKSGRQEWVAAISTDKQNSDVTLVWDGIGNLPRRSQLVLTDTTTGRTIPMNSRSSYTFRSGEAGSTRQFKIALRSQPTAGPLQILNLTTTRNSGRAAGSTSGGAGLSVRFTTTQDAEVTATVRTLTGKAVATLGSGTQRSAALADTTLRWDGRSYEGSTVPFGPYIVEVKARTASGEVTTVKRTVQLLR